MPSKTIGGRSAWHTHLRQGVRPVGDTCFQHRRDTADDGSLLHALGRIDPGKGITPDIEVALARIEKLDGGNFREENLKGALDGSEDSDVKAQNEDEDKEPFDQSKIDFQLARALDLIRGINVFESIKSPS